MRSLGSAIVGFILGVLSCFGLGALVKRKKAEQEKRTDYTVYDSENTEITRVTKY